MTGNLKNVNVVGAWLLGFLWLLPLLYAIWAAIHPIEYQVRFDIFAPLTLFNFKNAWAQAPFAQYMLNTLIYVTLTTSSQFVVCALAAFAFARFEFPLKNVLFARCQQNMSVFPPPGRQEQTEMLMKRCSNGLNTDMVLPIIGES